MCSGCAYGKVHRKPCRHKGHRKHIQKAICPGEVVSINQMISTAPGFVLIHRGKPTTKRYIGATVFADHYSDFTYVHLIMKLDAESTTEAKRAFKYLTHSHGVTVPHYHADNSLFETKMFLYSIKKIKPVSVGLWSQCTPSERQGGKLD